MPNTSGAVPATTAPKGRYVTLDALRGLAAAVVVYFHVSLLSMTQRPKYGYLAVDLFFLMSGFVLAVSYDGRLANGLSWLGFLKLRAARLYPIYAVGLVLGATSLLLFGSPSHLITYMSAIALAIFGLPGPYGSPSFPAIAELNSPFWSLFFEFWVANLAFSLLWRQLRGVALILVIGACAAGLIFSEAHFHTMNVGWGWPNIAGGLPRVGYSFFAGVFIARVRPHIDRLPSLPSWACLLATFALLIAPIHRGRLGEIYELACVLGGFPLIVALSSRAKERLPEIGKIAGNSSYAAYGIHWPLIVILMVVHPAYLHHMRGLEKVAATGIIMVLGVALDAFYDGQARRLLASMLTSPPRLQSQHDRQDHSISA